MHLSPPPPPPLPPNKKKKKEEKERKKVRKRKKIMAIVFDFSWDDCKTQEKLKTMVMQNLGVNKCIMVSVKMVNAGELRL